MKVEYADLAKEDLAGIFAYSVQQRSRAQARAYLRAINQHVLKLANGQGHHRIIPEREGILVSRIQSHYVIFTKGEDPVLRVRRVLHASMDTLAHI